MDQQLPSIVKTQSLSLHRKSIHLEFPSISRFIPESVFSKGTVAVLKVTMISIVSGLLLLEIVNQSFALWHNYQVSQQVKVQRESVTQELKYWQQVADIYKGYRDVYIRIATLEYKLGNIGEAKSYMQKATELDPNFDAGKVLSAKIGM